MIYACYSWEMAKNAGFDGSFDNIFSWKEIRQRAGQDNSTTAFITNDEIFR
jgi:hypothetical protein